MDKYTPTTEDVRLGYAYQYGRVNAEGLREFDRWLAAHDTQVRRKILDDIEAAAHECDEAWSDYTSGVGDGLYEARNLVRDHL